MVFINDTDSCPWIGRHRLADFGVGINDNLTIFDQGWAEGQEIDHTVFDQLIGRELVFIDNLEGAVFLNSQITIAGVFSDGIAVDDAIADDIASCVGPVVVAVNR